MINKIIKVIKILLIIMIYVVLFWGLIKWISYPFTHKSKCECACNCVIAEPTKEEVKVEETTAVVKEEAPKVEELKVEPKKEVKQEVKKIYSTITFARCLQGSCLCSESSLSSECFMVICCSAELLLCAVCERCWQEGCQVAVVSLHAS